MKKKEFIEKMDRAGDAVITYRSQNIYSSIKQGYQK